MSNSNGNTNDSSTKNTGLSTTHKILIGGFAFIAVLLIAGAVLLFQLMNKNTPTAPDDSGNFVIDESNLSEMTSNISQMVSDSMFEVNMNTSWVFPDGSSPSTNAIIANSTANKYDIAFDVTLENEEEPIYTSTIIPVGTQLNKLTLNKVLEKGNYNAVCTYHLLDKDGSEKSSLAVNITINIEK